MANAYTDPKYQMARLMRAQSGVGASRTSSLGPAPSESTVKLGRTAINLASANPTLAERLAAIGGGTSQPTSRGGVIGTVLGNPVAKTILKPLELLALPGKATIATIREVADARDAKPDTQFALGDIVKNIKDPEFGFGKAFNIDTGNKWIDRGIGLVGDIALDPLTYATFGAGKFAGYTGRLDLAAAVGKAGGSAELVNRVQRFGRAAIKDAEMLERVGANRHGLYFLGKRVKVGKNLQGLRLPGSGAIGSLGDNILSKLRIAGSETKAGKYIQRLTLPTEALAARQALLQGEVGDEAAAVVVSYLTASPVAKRAAGEALQKEEQGLALLLKQQSALGLDGFRKDLSQLIENPELLAKASPEMQQHAKTWIDWFKTYEDNIANGIKEIDATANPAFVENYFPRIQTADAFDYRRNPANAHAKSLNEIFAKDPMEGGGNFKARTLEVGDDWFGTPLTAEDLKSTDRLNELANEGGFVGKFFETDITKVAPKYLEEYSKEVGLLARHKHLVEGGFWERADAIEVSGEFVDVEMVKKLKKTVGSLSTEMLDLQKTMAKSNIGLVNTIRDYEKTLAKNLEDARTSLAGLNELDESNRALNELLNGSLVNTADGLDAAGRRVNAIKQKFAAMFGAKFEDGRLVMIEAGQSVESTPLAAEGLIGYLDTLENDILALRLKIDPLENEMSGRLEDLTVAHKDAAAATKLMEQRLKEANERIEVVTNFGNQLNNAMEAIVNGKEVGNLSVDVSHAIAIAARDATIGGEMVKNLIEKQFDVAGELQAWLRTETRKAGSIFDVATIHSGLSVDAVNKLKVTDVYDSLHKLWGGSMTVDEVRTHAIWSVMTDERLYGDNIPDTLLSVRANIVEKLQEIDAAIMFEREMMITSKGSRSTTSRIWESQVRPFADDARLWISEANQMDAFIAETEDFLKRAPGFTGQTVTAEQLESRMKKMPWLAKYVDGGRDSFSATMDLMNANIDVPIARPNASFFDGETFSIGSSNVADRALTVSSDSVGKTYTWSEMIEDIKLQAAGRKSKLDEEISFGTTGFNRKTMTYRQIADDVRKFEIVGKERARILKLKKEFMDAGGSEYSFWAQDYATKSPTQVIDPKTGKVMVDKTGKPVMSGVSRQSYADYYRTLTDEAKRISGGGSTIQVGNFNSVAKVKEELSHALFEYQLVSEVHSRFNAMAELSASMGVVPTQRMFASITESVSQKFIPKLEAQISNVSQARTIMYQFDRAVSDELIRRAGEGVSHTQVFRDVYASLTEKQREVLSEVLGPDINTQGDAYTLRRSMDAHLAGYSDVAPPRLDEAGKPRFDKNGKALKTSSPRTIAETEYFEKYVRPWFESRFPGRKYSKDAAKTELRRASPSKARIVTRNSEAAKNLTVFADAADVNTLKNFFEKWLGAGQSAIRATRTSGHAEGQLARNARGLDEARLRFMGMFSPDMNIAQFFESPGTIQKTATWYAASLDNFANELERRIAVRAGHTGSVKEGIAEVRAAIGRAQTAEDAVQTFVKPAQITAKRAELAELRKQLDTAVRSRDAKLRYKQLDGPYVTDDIKTLEAKVASVEKELISYENIGLSQEMISAIQETRDALKRAKQDYTAAKKSKDAKAIAGAKTRVQNLERELSGYNRLKLPKAVQLNAERSGLVGVGDKTLERAQDVVDRYNVKMASPLYAKAHADREIVDALDVLAEWDISKFTEGFTADGINYATMPDGSRLVLSKAEWESLFLGRSRRGDLLVNREQLRQQIYDLTSENRQYNRFIAEAEAQLEAARAKPKVYDVQSYEDVVAGYRRNVRQNQEIIRTVQDRLDSSDPGVAAAALEKMRILVHGNEARTGRWSRAGSSPVFDKDGLKRWSSHEHPTIRQWMGVNDPSVKAGQLAESDMETVRSLFGTVEGYRTAVEDGKLRLSGQSVKTVYENGVPKIVSLEYPTMEQSQFIDMIASRKATGSLASRVWQSSLLDTAGRTAERRNTLRDAWRLTDEARYLGELNALENNVYVTLYNRTLDDAQKAVGIVDDFRNAVREQLAQREVASAAVESKRAQGVAAAEMATNTLEAETGVRWSVPKPDGSKELLLAPRTPDEMRVYAEGVRQAATPSGPFVVPISDSVNSLLTETNTVNAALGDAWDSAVNAGIDVGNARVAEQQAAQALEEFKNGPVRYVPTGRGLKEARVGEVVPAKEGASRFRSVNEATKAWESRIKLKEDVAKIIDGLRKKQSNVQLDMINRFGSAEGFFNEIYNKQNLIPALEKELADVRSLLVDIPSKDFENVMRKMYGSSAKGVKKLKLTDEMILNAREAYTKWLRDSEDVFKRLGQDPENPVYKAWASATMADENLIQMEIMHREALFTLTEASTPQWVTRVIQPFADEWNKASENSGLKRLGSVRKDGTTKDFPGLVGNKEAIELLDSMARLRAPGVVDDLARFTRGYTGFFRGYATLSPGFHVRNSISNVFSMFAAGADIGNMRKGFKLWRLMDQEFSRGGTIESFVKLLDDADKEFGRYAAEIAVGMHGSKVSEALRGFEREGSILTDNAALSSSKKFGTKVEGSARFMLAYDSLSKGMDANVSYNRVKRFLIDYNERTVLDEMMRDIIPFWTWMSRNLPVQIMNRWTNPKTYLMYEHFRQNFNEPESSDNLIPFYLKKSGINLGGGNVLAPDLPMDKADEMIQNIQDPRKLLSMVNPGVRVPFEMLTNYNTFTNQPFKDEYVKIDGALSALEPILQMLGQVKKDPSGNSVASKKAVYAAQSMIPMLGQGERISNPGGFSAYVGSPLKNISEGQSNAEAYRRMADMQALVTRQENIGKAR
jgi:hypothetical protein